MITIIGDYCKKNKKLIIIILSKKNYNNYKIFINNIYYDKICIEKYKVNKFILNLFNFDVSNITIKIIKYKNTIEEIKKLNLYNIYNNIEVVNCDSILGLEKNLWKKMNNYNSHYIIHCGDQIYNDKIFKKFYRYEFVNEENLNKLDKEIFLNYYKQFYRYKKILKQNCNLMIPDDHEIVDNSYIDKHNSNKKFILMKKRFCYFLDAIQLGLKLNNDDLYFIEDKIHKSIFVLNYTTIFNNNFFNKFDFDNKINEYDNIILISRKNLMSKETHKINQLIYQEPAINIFDIDFLLKKIIKNNKKMFIFCGDDHSYKNSIITYKNKEICNLITCGSINTVPELIKNKYFLQTNINNVKFKLLSYEFYNNFMKIYYDKNNSIKIDNKYIKQNTLNTLIDNIKSIISLI